MIKCFQIHSDDNTAVLLEDAKAGDTVELVGALEQLTITLRKDIPYGHKVALAEIPKGDVVTKYGICIGHSTQTIMAGDWVHLHNCASAFDERSSTLDVHTGAVTDTVYE